MQGFLKKALLTICGTLLMTKMVFAEPPFLTLPDESNLYYEEVPEFRRVFTHYNSQEAFYQSF